jgi:hypothetical protein
VYIAGGMEEGKFTGREKNKINNNIYKWANVRRKGRYLVKIHIVFVVQHGGRN